ncbi:putative cell division control protein 10 protein [Botrytis fragariae]|uniref:Putative cell division control protein 10 protein n=1 Tax=Botrytis fragariae TaxID=1964551 RepID=A0A8H6ALL8_9HELO|nr:putative cell division control protein 10 protein [Botrytis fragariae]KAF5869857.1 putative cell division control protein 10 protein [Botrytis fragariae]
MSTITDRHAPQPSVFPKSHVGFDSITSQIERKLLKRGFQFNVICVGQTGLGKSTLINTIFASHLIDSKGRLTPDEPVRSTTEIQTVSHIIEENGVKLRLNIVDTPGYGDQVNNDRCWDPIVKYIKDQHSAYLRKELTAQRERYIQDTRIHCCLFFIQPSGHALKPIDIVVLKKLSDVVNVVPVIAKSDSLTLEERAAFKERIKEEFAFHNLKMFPYENDEFDEEEKALNAQIKDIIPFAVVGSEKDIIVGGKPVRGRQNRWGVINVEDENHCEFVYLRNFLTRTHLQDLIETTSQIHYETFRAKQLLALKESSAAGHAGSRPISPSADRELSRNSQRMTMNVYYAKPQLPSVFLDLVHGTFAQGVKQIHALTPPFPARYVFISPPSTADLSPYQVLEKRLRGRGTEKEESIQKRLEQAKLELEYSKKEGVHDKIIVNDDLEVAYKELEDYIFGKGGKAADEKEAGVSVQD